MTCQDRVRSLPLDHLRTFLTLPVVLHHALLAYAQLAPPVQPVFGRT